MKLNFSISELIHSDIAIKNNINNMPDLNSMDNLLNLIFFCLQPVRNLFKKPIIITSGYRCEKINSLVGGSKNSQHKFGQAADFVIKGYTPKEIIDFVKTSNIDFDQLINEYDSWIHISYVKNKNRRQIL